ncbi:hypothetical protein UYA_21910 [Ectopseudomonas alcaliphila JAB1]|nr:hypothetical protein [Pseudomonas alcaliphila]APU32250.1 hypothetical protein UYA_21910 [Pseudomonas alcaliphila JAB1]
MAVNQNYPIPEGTPDSAKAPLAVEEISAVDALLLCRHKRIQLLSKARDQRVQVELYRQLQFFSSRLPAELAALEPLEFYTPSVTRGDERARSLQTFWTVVQALLAQGHAINHAHNPELLALNLPQLRSLLANPPYQILIDREMHRALRVSDVPRFIGEKKVHSVVTGKSSHCWVFRLAGTWR